MLNPVPLGYKGLFDCHKYSGYEMFCGDIFPVSMPPVRHQSVSLKIASALLKHIETNKLGTVLQAPCSVIFSPLTVIQPDVLFVKSERIGMIGKTSLRGIPDLIIEILSPRSRNIDLAVKKRIYSQFEVPEYWTMDPDSNTAVTMVWSELGYVSVGRYGKSSTFSSPLLPQLNLRLADIFEESKDQPPTKSLRPGECRQ
jgi:Uma2 family endonuclease